MSRRKSFWRYIGVTLISAIVGGAMGYLAMQSHQFVWSLQGLFKTIPVVFCTLFLITMIIVIIVTIFKYNKGKKYLKLIDDDDEDIFLLADKEFSLATTLNSFGQILGMIGLGLVIPVMNEWRLADVDEIAPYPMFISLALLVTFIVYMVISTIIHVKAVDMIKKIYPEKKGYVLDKRFEKTWLDSCDEHERRNIGEASYYAYKNTSKVLSWAIVISLFIGMFNSIAYVFVLIIGGVWLVLFISYSKKINELEFKKK